MDSSSESDKECSKIAAVHQTSAHRSTKATLIDNMKKRKRKRKKKGKKQERLSWQQQATGSLAAVNGSSPREEGDEVVGDGLRDQKASSAKTAESKNDSCRSVCQNFCNLQSGKNV